MRRVAADDDAEGEHAGVAPRPRECHRAERQLEGAGHLHHVDAGAVDAGLLEELERAGEELRGQLAVEARDDDPDGATGSVRGAGEDADSGGDVEVARRVLLRDTRLGLGSEPERPTGQIGGCGLVGLGLRRLEVRLGLRYGFAPGPARLVRRGLKRRLERLLRF